jgi:glycosyltransferase involved in cell wall biosynthesis
MKIAYVYDAVYPWENGGIQKRVWELARRLSDNHDVHWYGLRYWDGPTVYERDGVTLHGIADPPKLYVNGRRSISEALFFGAHLARPLLRGEFDVIDCQAFPYFSCFPSKLGAVTRGATLFVTWHEVWMAYWREYLGRKGVFGEAIESVVARMPDEHITVSERTRRDLDAIGAPHSHLVPNGIAMDTVRAAPATTEPIDILFVGRLIEEKNVDLLVRAVAMMRETVPDVHCHVVGDVPERAALESQIADFGLEEYVTMLGFREKHEEILGLMKTADVFVLPSRREGFGITALEALACGTPVVTIDHPQNAAAALIEDSESGYVTNATPEAVADATLAARTDISPETCTTAAEGYEWDAIARQAETVYEEAST